MCVCAGSFLSLCVIRSVSNSTTNETSKQRMYVNDCFYLFFQVAQKHIHSDQRHLCLRLVQVQQVSKLSYKFTWPSDHILQSHCK